jgi:hypothetical protein
MRMAESRFDCPGGALLNEDPEHPEEHVLSCLLGLEGPSKRLGSRYKAVRRPRQPQTERRPGSPPSQVVGTHEAREAMGRACHVYRAIDAPTVRNVLKYTPGPP